VGDGAARELAADHRRALQHQPLFGPQPLDARGEQRLDRRGHLDLGQLRRGRPALALALERAVVHQHPHQLAEEEGVALVLGEHAAGDGGGQRVGADHVGGQARGRSGVEAGEGDDVGDDTTGGRQRRARGAQLGPCRRQHQQRHPGAPLHQVLGQVEQQRLGPLEVVDFEHHRPRRGERGQQAAHHEEGLFGRGRRPGEQRADAGGDAGALGLLAGHHGVDRRAQRLGAGAGREAEVRAQRLGQRREGGSARGVALGAEHARTVSQPARQLGQQARLAEPRRAQHHGQPRRGRGDGRVVHRAEPPQLVAAPDERDGRRAGRPLQRHHPERRHRLGPALEREAAHRLERHQLAHQALRLLADQDVAVARLLLEPRRDVQRIADAGGVLVADHDLAGVDRDTQAQLARQLALGERELAERALHLDRGAHRADRVVLGHARHAEGAHHAVAEQLHHAAAVGLDRRAHRAVVAVHEAAHGLRVEPLVQRGGADQVGEDDRDDLARRRGFAGGRGQGGAAGVTEMCVGCVLGAAGRAARGQRAAAAAAEARACAVDPSAARAGHGVPDGEMCRRAAIISRRRGSAKPRC
jgi:hypothetical protein